jgi:hypothetical protein
MRFLHKSLSKEEEMNKLTNVRYIEKNMVSIGSLIWIGEKTDVYIVAQVEDNKAKLIGLSSGNRWNEDSMPVNSKVSPNSVYTTDINTNTHEEWGFVNQVTVIGNEV